MGGRDHASHALHGCCDHRWRPRRLNGCGDARPCRHCRRPDRSPRDLSAGASLRKARRQPAHLLRKTGLADATLRATTLDGEVWEARYGHVVTRKPSDQHGIMYDTLVNTMRAQIPSDVPTIHAKVVGISNSAERQKLVLSNDEEISARLVVLSNGLNIGLRHHARHQAPGSQRMPFGHAWLRRRAGRTASLRVSGADLLAGQAMLPGWRISRSFRSEARCAPI